jgi:hypothetical protein
VKYATGNIPSTAALNLSSAVPTLAPAGVGYGLTVMLPMLGTNTASDIPPYTLCYFDPRTDGLIRVYAGVGGTLNMYKLDGLSYSVI